MTSEHHSQLFSPFALAGLSLRSHVVMAPMTTWSGNDDGTISDEEVASYRRRVNGVGLVITGCTHVSQAGVGFTDEFAAFDDCFIPSLRRLADAARSGGAPAMLQIFHAGLKAIPELIPDGIVVGPSDSDGSHGAPVSRALKPQEILGIVQDFAAATRRAIAAGFDGVELHGAHGFLLQNFLSPQFNQRTDEWGGDLENRMRFALTVTEAVRSVIDAEAGRPFVLGYRVSPEESGERGLRIGDVETLFDRLIALRVDYIHVSLASVLNTRSIDAGDETIIARRLADYIAGRVPLIAAGHVRTPLEAEQAIATGLSLVAVGKGLVINPDWVELAMTGEADRRETALRPSQIASLAIPNKLWTAIKARPGWFDVTDTEVVSREQQA